MSSLGVGIAVGQFRVMHQRRWSLPQMLVVMIFRITPCWHWRLPRASVGKSIDWISTTPGSMNASPRLLLIGASLRSESSDPIQLDLAREALVPGTCGAHPRRRQGPSTTDSHEPQENTHSDSFLQVSSTGSPGLRGHPEEPGVPGPVRSGQRHRDGLPDDTALRRRYPLSGIVKLTKTRRTNPQDDRPESCREPDMLGVGQPDSAQLDNTRGRQFATVFGTGNATGSHHTSRRSTRSV